MARCRPYAALPPPPPSPPSVNDYDPPTKRACHTAASYIDALPDDVLIGIISRLPIRDAVATGGVAARWRHLWKHAPRLSLRPCHLRLKGYDHDGEEPAAGEADDERAARFAAVASSVLRQHRGVGLDKLVFELPLAPGRHAAELEQAVAFAAAADAPELHFSLAASSRRQRAAAPAYEFPHWRFAGGRLRRLVLGNVSLAAAAPPPPPPRGLEGLAQLKLLTLTGVAVDDAGVASVLSACGALLGLELRECPQLAHLTAAHAGLVLLDVDSCGGLKSITLRSSRLHVLSYRGHRVDVDYTHAPSIAKLTVLFPDGNGCPLDCIGGGGGAAAAFVPKLKHLFLQFPSPVNAACSHKFAALSKIVLLLMKTPWREHVVSVANLLRAAPSVKELCIEVHGDLPMPPPDTPPMAIRWPKRCSPRKLRSVAIGGFGGEAELVELALFLARRSPALRTVAVDTHRRHLIGFSKRNWCREESEDPLRCYYARGIAWTHLAPKIPSTVKFTVL
ncbi:hypothetical protein ACP4OV_011796 [Aristida adscensionis]